MRKWQSQRLERTYTDLLVTERYGPACRFFLDDVYSAKDFRQRDHEIKHLYAALSRYLPDALLKLVKKVIELNDLTNALDEALLEALRHDLGVDDAVTPELYAAGYRVCNNYAERLTRSSASSRSAAWWISPPASPYRHDAESGAPAGRPCWLARTARMDRARLPVFPAHARRRRIPRHLHDREMKILGRIFAGDPQPFQPVSVTTSKSRKIVTKIPRVCRGIYEF